MFHFYCFARAVWFRHFVSFGFFFVVVLQGGRRHNENNRKINEEKAILRIKQILCKHVPVGDNIYKFWNIYETFYYFYGILPLVFFLLCCTPVLISIAETKKGCKTHTYITHDTPLDILDRNLHRLIHLRYLYIFFS
jgi:hypothetical protein